MSFIPRVLPILLLPLAALAQSTTPTPAATAPSPESLIDQLPSIDHESIGFSSTISGSAFAPVADSAKVSTGLLTGQPQNGVIELRTPPAPPNSFEQLVRLGPASIPSLLKHLDDPRPTRIPPIKKLMWSRWSTEYDYNAKTRKTPPDGVNKRDDATGPDSYALTTGDLCFVALGQIVNRNFTAARYQPTGGIVVNSPSHDKALADNARQDFADFTPEKHRKSLIDDFTHPDYDDRRIGALVRVAFYYPTDVEPLVLKQLEVPYFNVFECESLVRDQLYPEPSIEKRKQFLVAFLKTHGPATTEGVLRQLYDDLDLQIADEGGHVSPPLLGKYKARQCLVQLFNAKPDVKPADEPPHVYWDYGDVARFIDVLGSTSSLKIDDAIFKIFTSLDTEEYLALACIRRLRGKGHDDALRTYAQSHANSSHYFNREFQELLPALASPITTRPSF